MNDRMSLKQLTITKFIHYFLLQSKIYLIVYQVRWKLSIIKYDRDLRQNNRKCLCNLRPIIVIKYITLSILHSSTLTINVWYSLNQQIVLKN